MKYKNRYTYIYNPRRNITFFCTDNGFNESNFMIEFKLAHPNFNLDTDHLYLKDNGYDKAKTERRINKKKDILTGFMSRYASRVCNDRNFINNNF